MDHCRMRTCGTLTLVGVGLIASFVYTHTVQAGTDTDRTQEPSTYTVTDQHALSSPAVVRVLHAVDAEIRITPFTFNLDTLRATAHPTIKDTLTVPLEGTMTGSAFSISEKGIFVTNAHVATADQMLLDTAAEVLLRVVVNQGMALMERYGPSSKQFKEYTDKLEAMESIDDNDPRIATLLSNVLSFFVLVDNGSRLAVVPQGTSVTRDSIAESGYVVKKVHTHKEWYVEDQDVAILVTEAPTLIIPALQLAPASSTVTVNTEVAAYGFPGSTDLSLNTFSDVTVTRGHVTSLKQASSESPTTIQIDAKVSKGSSGGPLVNQSGKVVGIITAETGSARGDNFAFALPVTLVHTLLEEALIGSLTTEYAETLRVGLALKEQRRCKKAQESFTRAQSHELGATTTALALAPLQSECDALIASGQSIDTPFDEFAERLRQVPSLYWILGGFGALSIVVGLGLLVVLRSRRDPRTATVNTQPYPAAPTPPLPAAPIPTPPAPHLSTPPAPRVPYNTAPAAPEPLQKPQPAASPLSTKGWYINSHPVSEPTDTES